MHAVDRIPTDDFFVRDDAGFDEPSADELRGLLTDDADADDDAETLQINGNHKPAVSRLRERIEVTPDEHVVIDKTLDALAGDKGIYHREGRLVHVIHQKADGVDEGIERSAGTPRIAAMSSGYLRERMAARCYFWKMTGTSETRTETQGAPPGFAVDSISTRGFWTQLRRLSGIVETPVLRGDGTILDSPGWDSQTELLFHPTGEIPRVEERPTFEDAIAARDELLDVVCDFPFGADTHRAAWLAGLLTPLARRAFSGPAPLFLIDANVRGSGKSMSTDIISTILTGREMPRLSNPGDDDEARKRITSIALAGDPLVLIDNIGSTLGSASLDAALTSTLWKDRRLATNEMIEAPLRAVWFATGNNVMLLADTSRRVCHIRLESPEENPEERQGFRHPHLIEHVRRNRLRLLTAGLTILRAFVVAGKPDADLKPWGSFEGWSNLIRNCLAWIEMPDPGETRRELAEQSDRDASALRALFAGWSEVDPKGDGLTAAELVKMLDANEAKFEGVRSALVELCNAPGGKAPSARLVGNQLRRFRGRVIGGQRLDYRESSGRTRKWSVSGQVQPKTGDTGDTSDTVSHPLTREGLKSIEGTGLKRVSLESPQSPSGACGNCGVPTYGVALLCEGCDPDC